MVSKEEMATDGDNEGPVREKLKQTSIDAISKDSTTVSANGSARVTTESAMEPSTEAGRASDLATTQGEDEDNREQPRGRHTRKRSFDDLVDTSEQASGHQVKHSDTVMGESKRKRSSEVRSQERLVSGNESTVGSLPAETEHKPDKIMSQHEKPHEERSPARGTPEQDELMGVDRVLSPKKKRSRDQFDKDFIEAPGEGIADQPGRSSGESERDAASTGRASRRSNREEPEKKRPRDLSKDISEKQQNMKDSVRRRL